MCFEHEGSRLQPHANEVFESANDGGIVLRIKASYRRYGGKKPQNKTRPYRVPETGIQ